MRVKTRHFAAVALLRAATEHFNKDKRNFIGSTSFSDGNLSVKIEESDFEIWHTLTHINNTAECVSMLASGAYDDSTNRTLWLSKKESEAVLDDDGGHYSISKLVRLDKVIHSFIKTFSDG